jgi:tetratricopeptide (TPR) repeat protein
MVLALTACVAPAAAAEAPSADPAATFEHANQAFEQGAALLDTDKAKAHAHLDEAIEGYRSLIDDDGITNPKLYYNLGNAYMMEGDLGRAIVAYRRASRLNSEDENLRANLAYARSRVETSFRTDEASRVYRALLGWQNGIPIRARLAAFVVLFGVGWLIGLIRLTEAGRRALPRWAMVVALVLSALPAASLALTAERRGTVQGVVVADAATGRKGPETSYEPSFTRDLSGGVEFRLLESRPGWVYVRLPDGRTTWLTRDSVEII